ncbi:hypothetical protein MASR2M18_00620 [Ignavibacteria bacterium]|nr:hypothetical protein [Bacteroidota bacterium]MCZ2133616.1 hypothetical protein [Bacteroidota bacterium]
MLLSLRTVLLAIVLHSLCVGSTSALDPDKFLSQYVHDAWLVESGLPSNTIPAIMQSKSGYLWIGTLQGLARFDGAKFTVYDRNNSSAMRSHQVLAIGEDKTGALLWGTLAGGLFAFDGNTAKKIELPDKLRGEPSIFKTLYSSNGDLWICANSGVFRKSGSSFTAIYAKEAPPGYRYTIVEDIQKRIWLGTPEGLMKFDNGSLVNAGIAAPDVRTAITELIAAPDGAIWAGTNNGAVLLTDRNGAMSAMRIGTADNAVTALLRDRDGNIWIGTKNGLSRLTNGKIQPLPKELIPNDAILSLAEDHEGSLWIGTFANGLHRLRDGAFTTISAKEGLADNYARSIIENSDGSLLIATANGLNKMNGLTVEQASQSVKTPVNALWKSRDGAIWIGGTTLTKIHGGTSENIPLAGKEPDEIIYCIIDDANGNMWVGTSRAIYRFGKGKILRLTTANGLTRGLIANILPTKNGDVYVATFGGGLSVIRGENCSQIGAKQGLTSTQIFDLREDDGGTLWISTAGDGLFRLKNGQCKRLTWNEGLYDNTIYRILEDSRANFWMSCPKAVFRVAKSELNAVLDGNTARCKSTEYGVRDGMRSGECNSGFFPAGWRADNGLMYFPTTQGVVRVDPAKFPVNTLEPPVIIETVQLDSIEAKLSEPVIVPAGVKKIEIFYTGLSLFKPENVTFRYKLEGYDNNWVEIGGKREIRFTNLLPGEYNFTVTACNNDGVWNTSGANIRFVVEPFFYQTWLFRSLLVLGGLAAIYGLFALRVRQLKKREIHLRKVVDERTKDLSDANSSLHEANSALAAKIREIEELNANLVLLNDEKTTFLGIAAHDLKNPLAGIILTAQNIAAYIAMLPQQKIVDYITKIEHSAQRMRDIILHILDINAIETGKIAINIENIAAAEIIGRVKAEYSESAAMKNIKVTADIPPDSAVVRADKNCLTAVLDNLASNAVKFSPLGSEIRISYSDAGRKMRIVVIDQGPGLTDEDKKKAFGKFAKLSAKPTGGEHSSGLGLSIVKKMAEATGCTVGCESEYGKGSTFYIEIPKA